MYTTEKIKNIADVMSGVYLKTSPNADIAYLQVKDFSAEEPFKMAAKTFMSPKIEKNLLQVGDILFAAKGSAYLAVCFKEPVKAVASTAFFIIRIKDERFLPEYLCWFLNQHIIESHIRGQQQGTGLPVIRKSVLEDLEIPLLEIEKQNLIVKIANLSEKEYQLRKSIAQKKKLVIESVLMKISTNEK